jgi:signal transduction histidine kinase
MNDGLQAFESKYAHALRGYIDGGGEATLHEAYELGRGALASGVGVLAMAALQHAALLEVCREAGLSEKFERILQTAEGFARESISPFEMAHRGVTDANSALRRINEILEEQIQRIARELHDDAGQLLASVHLALHEVGRGLAPSSRQKLLEVRGLLDRIEEQLRRISHELRPLILDDLGLVPAIQFLGDGVSKRAGIVVIVKGPTEERLPPVVETALYRIVQEALNNAARHAKASRVTVTVQHTNGQVRCSIRDDGVGFKPAAGAASNGRRGLGLIGIRERIAPLSGTLEIQSGERKGTELLVTIPLETIRA